MVLLRRAPLPCGEPGLGWQSPVTIPRLWLAAIFAACALFAAGMGLFSTDSLHRLWGLFAVIAYGLAAGLVLAWRSSRAVDLALVLAVGGALLAPLSLLAEQGRWQPEVGVIARGARLLLQHGSPYESQAVVTASHDPNIYNPYLPVMAIFGLPRALLGSRTHHRPADLVRAGLRGRVRRRAGGLGGPGCAALDRARHRHPGDRVLADGGGHRRPGARPALPGPGAALAPPAAAGGRPGARRRRGHQGNRLARPDRRGDHAPGPRWPPGRGRFLLAAVAAAAVIVGPVAAVWPHALVENTILFPLGLAKVKSQAVSPLPGHLLADTGPTGHTIAVALLCLAGLGVLVSLVVRPPRNVPSATWRLIIGLVLMFVLAPATRFGYFMYPLGLWAWLIVSQLGARRALSPGRSDEDAPGGPPPHGGVAQPSPA